MYKNQDKNSMMSSSTNYIITILPKNFYDDPVAFLSGTVNHNVFNIVPVREVTVSSKIWLCYDCNKKIC